MRMKSKKFIDTALSILCAHHFKHLPKLLLISFGVKQYIRQEHIQKESDYQFQQSLIQYL